MATIRKLLSRTFKTYPLVSNAVIYGGIHATAEVILQATTRKQSKDPGTPEEKYDIGAIKRFGIIGTCGISPTLYYWYRWLDRKYPGAALKTVLRKSIMDQTIMTPVILTIFYVGMSLMERREDVFAQLKQKFMPTYTASMWFWVPAQGINFAFIPPQFRIVYMAGCTLLWATILCSFHHEEYGY